MNNQRRKALLKSLDLLDELRNLADKEKALEIVNKVIDKVQQCADEEEEALDNRPQSLMWSATNDDMAENINDLNDSADNLRATEEEIQEMKRFDYELVKTAVVEAVNTIKQTIHR